MGSRLALRWLSPSLPSFQPKDHTYESRVNAIATREDNEEARINMMAHRMQQQLGTGSLGARMILLCGGGKYR